MQSQASSANKKLHYQLQNYGPGFIDQAALERDTIWVIDRANFSTFDLLKLKENNNLAFSYMSIGEAESYRSYFKQLPKDIILAENKNWKENFTVKFWDEAWHKVIYQDDSSYIDQIVDIGFDGVYLDIVDAFSRFQDKEEKAAQMVDLIVGIANKARQKNPFFQVYLQNGIEIINSISSTDKARLFNSIAGASIEGYFFSYKKNGRAFQSDYFKTFEPIYAEFINNNKRIVIIEYVKGQRLQKMLLDYCQDKNLRCLITDRALKGLFFVTH